MPTVCSLKKLAWIPLVAAASVSAQPTVSVDSVTLDSDNTGVTSDTYNGAAAVCRGNIGADLGVTAAFTPTFSSDSLIEGVKSACTPQPSNTQPGDASWRDDFASRPVSHGLRHPANTQQVTAASALTFP
jgi:hypothetical protein